MADRPPPSNPFANMGALFGLQDPSGLPADTRMLETIIGEITGQKRGYLTQKIKHYESQLKSDNDVVLMQTLTELNSDLTMTAEDQWIGQPLNETVQGVLNCLDMEFLPEVMIMASTCLINILEVSPESARCIAENGGLERLGLKLMNNELTENIIAVLEKISQEYSNVILSSGVMEMLMNVIDFLVVQSQVSILKIVSRVFKSFSNQDQDLETKILPILPKIKEVLLNSDRTEEVSVEIYLNLTKRIAKLYENDREEMENKIDQVALQNDTLPFLMGLAERAVATPEGKAHNLVLNLFTIFNKFAYMSSNLSEELMTRRIDQLVLRCLDSSSDSLQGENSKMVMNEIISFINTLLSLNNYQNELFQKVFALAGIEIIKHYNTEKKVRFIEEHGELVKDLLSKIAKDCTTIYETSDDFFFKYLFLTALRKITMFLDSSSMQGCVDQPIIANFISKTLDSTDIIITMITLFIIQSLVEKLPEIKRSLSRHGIIGCLKRLAIVENLQGHVVPEVSKKPDQAKTSLNAMLSDQFGRKLLMNQKKEHEDLLKQLQNWQNNPKSFEEGLNRMRNIDKPQIREGDEDPDNDGEEEHDQDQDRTEDMDEPKPEKSRRKGTEGIEEAQEEQRFDEESQSTSSPSRLDQDLTSSMMIPEDIEPERMLLELKTKKMQSTIERMREEPFGESPPQLKTRISTPMDIERVESPVKSLNNSAAKVVVSKADYSLQDAREDLARVAQETLDKIGADQSEVSQEFLELMRISNLLQKHDVEGLVQLNQFFAGESNMTFYEFSQANILKPIIEWFFNEGHAFEEVVKFLQGFFSTFYTNSSAGLEQLYSNLLEFIRRRPEVTPCFSNDQLARSSFVQELKFLSTPLKIKVSFNQGLARSFSREEFLMELTQEFPYLEMSTKEGLFQDVDKMHKWFKETFLGQSTVYLQVERFASLKSVEVYLIDKFGVKSLSSVSDEFAKKRAKDSEDGHEGGNRRNPNDGDSESILTSGYLEKRLEEQMNFGKEKDIRRYFEKQYLRKPSKLIGIKFELKIQRADGGITRKPVSLNTTLHELLFILTKELPRKGVAVIELDYSVEVKTEIYHRGPKVKQEVPEHKSSLTVLYGDIKKKLEAFRAGMRDVHIPEELQNIGLGLKLFIELDKLKARYIDGSASKVGQMIELDQGIAPTLGVKLTDQKLSTVYTKIFMKPSKILGQSFPQLSKILCVHVPELLDFNTRYYFFKHLQFEPTRAMYFIYQANKPAFKEIPGSKIGKLKRKKLKINRDQILEGARLTFSLSGFHTAVLTKNVLEFDFEQEEGSGLGPTLEFYSLLAEDFKKRKEMWRNTDDFSYFPKPFTNKEHDQRSVTSEINTWKILGAIVGRSVLDERIFDMRFSECFWKIVLGRRVSLTDLRPLNEGLMKTLSGMQALVNKYQLLLNKSPDDQQTFDKLHEELTYNGVKIEDLCLVFTLPGYEDYELIPGGIKKEVNLDNLELYVELVIKTYLVDSIMPYIEAFREGLSMFIALDKLDCFLPEEMEMVVCGTKLEPWSVEYLKENISPMHGFHQGSTTFNNFLEVLSEFNEEQKREFLMFTIGAPRLPLGGLKNLSPRLTVVKKHPTNDRQSPDVILPSVMTCQNYIKLPDYSNKETLRRKLLVAMKEGQKSFTLS